MLAIPLVWSPRCHARDPSASTTALQPCGKTRKAPGAPASGVSRPWLGEDAADSEPSAGAAASAPDACARSVAAKSSSARRSASARSAVALPSADSAVASDLAPPGRLLGTSSPARLQASQVLFSSTPVLRQKGNCGFQALQGAQEAAKVALRARQDPRLHLQAHGCSDARSALRSSGGRPQCVPVVLCRHGRAPPPPAPAPFLCLS